MCSYIGSNGLIRVEANNVQIDDEKFDQASYHIGLDTLKLLDNEIEQQRNIIKDVVDISRKPLNINHVVGGIYSIESAILKINNLDIINAIAYISTLMHFNSKSSSEIVFKITNSKF